MVSPSPMVRLAAYGDDQRRKSRFGVGITTLSLAALIALASVTEMPDRLFARVGDGNVVRAEQVIDAPTWLAGHAEISHGGVSATESDIDPLNPPPGTAQRIAPDQLPAGGMVSTQGDLVITGDVPAGTQIYTTGRVAVQGSVGPGVVIRADISGVDASVLDKAFHAPEGGWREVNLGPVSFNLGKGPSPTDMTTGIRVEGHVAPGARLETNGRLDVVNDRLAQRLQAVEQDGFRIWQLDAAPATPRAMPAMPRLSR